MRIWVDGAIRPFLGPNPRNGHMSKTSCSRNWVSLICLLPSFVDTLAPANAHPKCRSYWRGNSPHAKLPVGYSFRRSCSLSYRSIFSIEFFKKQSFLKTRLARNFGNDIDLPKKVNQNCVFYSELINKCRTVFNRQRQALPFITGSYYLVHFSIYISEADGNIAVQRICNIF